MLFYFLHHAIDNISQVEYVLCTDRILSKVKVNSCRLSADSQIHGARIRE